MTNQKFEQDGFALIAAVIPACACASLIAQISQMRLTSAGSRNVLDQSWCRELVALLKTHPLVLPLLPVSPVAVQCTVFEKSMDKNWSVGIHQDLSIPVRDRINGMHCTGWAKKEGVLYAQPPVDVLTELVAVRLHLDDCGLTSGPLRVVPGSHLTGRLDELEAAHWRSQRGEIVCLADRGAALVMRPLILHSSSRATVDGVRRVLHFVFGPLRLPYGLNWHIAV